MIDSDDIRLFLIHAGNDQEDARRLHQWVNRYAGVRLVGNDDIELHSGDDPWEEMRDEILASDAVLFLATPEALDSEMTMVELGMAWGAAKPLIWVQSGPLSVYPTIDIEDKTTVQFEDFQNPEIVDDLLRPHRKTASA